MSVDGRPYILAQPDGVGQTKLPLIVALNGAGSNGVTMSKEFPLIESRRSEDFRVAYLSATRFRTASGGQSTAWNDGICCEAGIRPDADDSAYIADVIKRLQTLGLAGGQQSVAVVGHSNGAQMGYRFACEHGDMIFALVAISGGIVEKNCVGINGLRVLNIDGSNDVRYPIAGGRSASDPRIVHDSVESAGKSMTDGGATFKLQVVQGAQHSLADIDQKMMASDGVGLKEYVLNFIFAR